jgi:hypothetical protein
MADKFIKYATEKQRVLVEGKLEYMLRRAREVSENYCFRKRKDTR